MIHTQSVRSTPTIRHSSFEPLLSTTAPFIPLCNLICICFQSDCDLSCFSSHTASSPNPTQASLFFFSISLLRVIYLCEQRVQQKAQFNKLLFGFTEKIKCYYFSSNISQYTFSH